MLVVSILVIAIFVGISIYATRKQNNYDIITPITQRNIIEAFNIKSNIEYIMAP